MNYSEIKKNVIKKRWPKGEGKYGNDYRNLSKQIDNFIEHIKNAESPLQWLPLEIMTSEEIGDLICAYLDRSNENRLLLNNLRYKGMKYDYTDLIVDNPNEEKEMEMLFTISPGLKKYNRLKIQELIPEINIVLVSAAYKGYMKSARNLLDYIDLIYREILEEKALFKCIGLEYTNTDYIEQYITLSERITMGALFFLLIDNPNIKNIRDTLHKIEDKLGCMHETIQKEVAVARDRLVTSRKNNKMDYKLSESRAREISIYYVQFLERQALYGEQEYIIQILQAEAHENPLIFEGATPLVKEKIEEYSINELKSYILEDLNVPNFKIKYQETLKMINRAFNNDNIWMSTNQAMDVKIAFRELFVSKQTYNRKSSTTITRNLLAGENFHTKEIMFLNMKMIRGYFREKNMLKEYEIYSKICSCIRQMFLKSYAAINDKEAYRLIHRVCFEVLYLLGDSAYSGIEIE